MTHTRYYFLSQYNILTYYTYFIVLFCNTVFDDLPELGWNIRFVIKQDTNEKKYFIQTSDTYIIDEYMYKWCDVYGHVNANFSHYSKNDYPKIVSLVPSFGIDVYGKYKCWLVALETLLRSFNHIVDRTEWDASKGKDVYNFYKNIKHHIGRCVKTHNSRLKYDDYISENNSSDNYVFFLSTLWYNDAYNKNDEGVNKRRADFIRAVKNNSYITFEGGLLAGKLSSNELFKDVITYNGVSMKDWIEKTKKSSFVFNTPAFWNCHGWKLGEYLALGKCIISTPLSNDLPEPLVHGENIHFVDSYDSMCEAIDYIQKNPEYKHKLEQGARDYWNKYGTPLQSLRRLGIF